MSYYGITDQAAKEAQVAEVMRLHKAALDLYPRASRDEISVVLEAAVRKLAGLTPADSQTPALVRKV